MRNAPSLIAFLKNSLRLGISPRPQNLTERRLLYQKLAEYGEILYFKSNFYDRTIYSPDSALLIYRDKLSYDNLLAKSPLMIKIDRQTFDPLSLHWTYMDATKDQSPLDLGPRNSNFGPEDPKPSLTSTPFLQLELNPIETTEEKEAREERQMKKYLEQEARNKGEVEFRITASPFKGTQRSYLEYTPYWGAFKIRKSMIQRELAKDVPLHGLSDVEIHKRPPPLPVLNRLRRTLGKRKSMRQVYEEYQMKN